MPESLGVRLRQQREKRQVTLAKIAEQTKIKLSLLEELERDDISHWPTGIFRRAFVRSYAAAIGMDQEVAVRGFLEQFPEPVEVVEAAPAENGNGVAPVTSGPPTRFRYFVGSLLARFRGDESQPSSNGTKAASTTPAPWSVPAAQLRTDARAPEPAIEPASALAAEPAASEPELPPQVVAAPDLQVEAPRDLDDVARICTAFGQLEDIGQVPPLLEKAAGLLGAIGLIVWVWEGKTGELMPVLTQGYSDYVLALVPKVRRDSDNATAAAFRTAQITVVPSSEHASGALVAPLMSPAGCIGVLAIELVHGGEQQAPVRALATILAAQLARVIDAARPLEIADRRLA
jgi:helix-turn-helix protein